MIRNQEDFTLKNKLFVILERRKIILLIMFLIFENYKKRNKQLAIDPKT